ncbi:hypothetical protein D9M71_771090 [compost metagenome]
MLSVSLYEIDAIPTLRIITSASSGNSAAGTSTIKVASTAAGNGRIRFFDNAHFLIPLAASCADAIFIP